MVNRRSMAGIVLCVAAAAQAAEEPIATDRPDFVESSDVVGKGRIQLETSLAWERDARAGQTTRLRSTPTLLRLGLGETWELRLEGDGALRQRIAQPTGSQVERGWADLSIGAKWHLADGDETRGTPGLGVLVHLDLDSGSRAFRGQGTRPSIRGVAEWELAGGWSLGVMPGLYTDRDEEGRRFTGGILAAVAGKSLTEELRGFLEVSGQQIAPARHGGSVWTVDAGLAYLVTSNVQLDVAVSRGANRNSPDWAWTLGLSARY